MSAKIAYYEKIKNIGENTASGFCGILNFSTKVENESSIL